MTVDDREPVSITAGLLTALRERAADAEPTAITVSLGATAARAFDQPTGLPPDTPVLTHMYLPEAGGSVEAVFGVDLGRPAGGGNARFISHPQGPLAVTDRDDLAAAIIVAMPPWTADDVAAFDRSGRHRPLRVVDATPPEERLDGQSR